MPLLAFLGLVLLACVGGCGIPIDCKTDADCSASKPFCQGAVCKDASTLCPRLPCTRCETDADCPLALRRCENHLCLPPSSSGFPCLSPTSPACTPQEPCVSLLAGGPPTFADGPANAALFSEPSSLLFAPNGDLLLADTKNHRIRKLTSAGDVCTIAGRGIAGMTDGPAASARFSSPNGLLLAPDGSLWIADTGNHRLRRLTLEGRVETLSAAEGFLDGPLPQASFRSPVALALTPTGDTLVSDHGNQRIRKIDLTGLVSTFLGGGSALEGSPLSIRLCEPAGIALFQRTLLFTDACLHIVRSFADASIARLAGQGVETGSFADGNLTAARFHRPLGILSTPQGILIADSANHRLRLLDLTAKTVRTFAGSGSPGWIDGPPQQAAFREPAYLALAPDLSIVLSDRQNHRLRKLTPSGEVSTLAGDTSPAEYRDGPALLARFGSPRHVAKDSKGHLYITDETSFTIRMISTDGTVSTVAGSRTKGFKDGPALSASFCLPGPLAFDKNDNLFIADICNFRIRKLSPSGEISTVVGNGRQASRIEHGLPLQISLSEVRGLAVSPNQELFFSETPGLLRKLSSENRVTTVSGDEEPGFRDAPASLARFRKPSSLVFASDGSLFIADTDNHRIRKLSPSGEVSTIAGSGIAGTEDGPAKSARLSSPEYLALDTQGHLYITEAPGAVRKLSSDSLLSTLIPLLPGYQNGPLSSARFNDPCGLLLLSDRLLLLVDNNNRMIRQISFPSP